MSEISEALTNRVRTAHGYMQEKDWAQGTEQAHSGAVCVTGAVRLCAPQNGDEHLIRAVMRHMGRAEEWNDAKGRKKTEVLNFLSTFEITDADLKATFGPHWEAVVTLVRQTAALTLEQAETIAAARRVALGAARFAARDAARDAAWDAVWDAAFATVVQDLIDPEHYRTLMAPWWSVFGKN
mgnify:CR=1 FL=1